MLSSYNVEFNVRGNCTVLVDEALTSVIDNIVRNAIIHDRSDKIDITVSRTNDFCEIRTQITAMEYQMRLKIGCLMKNFYRETGHTGLSLYIVKKVCREV